MSSSTIPATGRFVWYDLMSTDVEKSKRYFTALFGWETQVVDMGGKQYPMFSHGGQMFGGTEGLPAGSALPSHWIAYISVDDIDAAAARVTELGGTVHAPPTDIPGTGRFAVISDPTGAFVALFSYGEGNSPKPEPEGMPEPGLFCWPELLTPDPVKASEFFGALLGWSFEAMDMGPGGTYHIAKRGEAMTAGLMKMPADAEGPPAWLHYVAVKDVDAHTKKAAELGGRVCVEPQDIPGMGRFSVMSDPTGAMFAMFQAVAPATGS